MLRLTLRNPLKSRKKRHNTKKSKPVIMLTRRQEEELGKKINKAVKTSIERFLAAQKNSPSKSRTSKKGRRSKTSKKR